MTNSATIQGVYLNVPKADWMLLKELVRKFGWQIKTREQILDAFIDSRPTAVPLSEEDIMQEVLAVRHGTCQRDTESHLTYTRRERPLFAVTGGKH